MGEEKDPLIREILGMNIPGMTYCFVNAQGINPYCGDFIELVRKGPKILLRAKGTVKHKVITTKRNLWNS